MESVKGYESCVQLLQQQNFVTPRKTALAPPAMQWALLGSTLLYLVPPAVQSVSDKILHTQPASRPSCQKQAPHEFTFSHKQRYVPLARKNLLLLG